MDRRRFGFVPGTLVGAAIAGVALAASGAAPHDGSLPRQTAAKYATKIVFENDRVRVRDVTFPPGVMDTGMHTHELAHVGVILTAGSLVFTEPGKPAETVKFEAASVGYRDANVTHQVANPGTGPMRVIEVELKQ